LKKDVKVYLDDMINAINEIETSTEGITFEAFAGNYEKINSVAYDVLILGKLPTSFPNLFRKRIRKFLGGY